MTDKQTVTGLGGVFFKGQKAEELRKWYEEHLGIPAGPYGHSFKWREEADPEQEGETVFSIFEADTDYLEPGKASFMLNFRVSDLDAILEQLNAQGVTVIPNREDSDYGRFAWIMDPEGNKIELWEPPKKP